MALTVLKKIAEKITQIGKETVEAQVIDTLVTKECDRRSEAVVQGIAAWETVEKELSKIRPDVETFDETGKSLRKEFSKSKLEEKNKLTAKKAKWEAVLTKALESEDFGDLYNLLKSDKGGSKPTPED